MSLAESVVSWLQRPVFRCYLCELLAIFRNRPVISPRKQSDAWLFPASIGVPETSIFAPAQTCSIRPKG